MSQSQEAKEQNQGFRCGWCSALYAGRAGNASYLPPLRMAALQKPSAQYTGAVAACGFLSVALASLDRSTVVQLLFLHRVSRICSLPFTFE